MVRFVITSFRDKATAAVFKGFMVKGLQQDMQVRAHARLAQIDAAERIDDLRLPPSNRLEKLGGSARWSIRINRQWRITFTWKDGNASNVAIEDYH